MAFFTKRYHPPGTAPGTLVESPELLAGPLKIHLTDFQPEEMEVRENIEVHECRPYLEKDSITWVHVQGHPTEAALSELGECFNLHSLALEDVFNTGQRPKVETFEDQLFVVMSLPLMEDNIVNVRQVSIFLNQNSLISFYNGDFTPFEPIIRRLREGANRFRLKGADYLLYAILDMVIDQGFPVLENFSWQLEDLEEEILNGADRETLHRIHILRRELILLRRMLWPQREVVNQFLRDNFALIQDDTRLYLRDCYDHTIQVMDLLETFREMTGSMLEIYMSSVSNRMNGVMKVLTVIATIFIPLTFIVGVYGMNFDRSASPWNMPELGWPYGYVLVWLVMIIIAAGMLLIFRRKGWF